MVITEKEKNRVIFSSLFDRHYPKLSGELRKIISSYASGIGTVTHTKDYWVRDFMPIQTDEHVFVKFTYYPDYLRDKKKYITDVGNVINNCPFVKDFVFINIPLIMDGGNMVFCKGNRNKANTNYVVMTEKVLVENPEFNKEEIELLFKRAFQEPDLIAVWLPWDKEDTFGHTDGIVKYVGINDEGKPRILINLELYDDGIADRMYSILLQHFEIIELQLSEYNELSWAYINSLQTQDFIIIPGTGNNITDSEAYEHYKELFPQYKDSIYQVQMHDFIVENGGALNCLTWTFHEDLLRVLLTEKYMEKNNPDEHNKLPVQILINDRLKDLPSF